MLEAALAVVEAMVFGVTSFDYFFQRISREHGSSLSLASYI